MVVFHTGGHMLMITHPRQVCDVLAAKMREAIKKAAATGGSTVSP
jgi:hypothetical protein